MHLSAPESPRRCPSETQAAIERFLTASQQPVLLEPGEDLFPLSEGNFAVEQRAGRLTIHVWDETRNLLRKISGVRLEEPGKLELTVERFGKRTGRLLLFDQGSPANRNIQRRGSRIKFREEFRFFLTRHYTDWKIAELSTEADLTHSLSPAYPRALLKKGTAALAVLCSTPDSGNANGALTFGLIWLEYLRQREKRLHVQGLALFLPSGQEQATCLRLRFLDQSAAQFSVFVYSPEGYVERLDLRDYGNLETKLDLCKQPSVEMNREVESWLDRLCRSPHVERIVRSDGSISLRVHGLEFARTGGGELHFGLRKRLLAQDANLPEIERIAAELARLRSPDALDKAHELYKKLPESWLESQVRSGIEQVDATLQASPIYGQVPAFTGGERGVMDLLAVDGRGRLSVAELKASEDIHLPMQALDYWMRVKWHLDQDEFSARGYFPGIPLSPEPPRLLLVAPSLDFHPTTEALLRYISPEIALERIGLAVEWRRQLKVMFRLEGASRPN